MIFPPAERDVASLYGLADALFFPSTHEGFGLPILEAALHRLPVFCADLEPMNGLLGSSLYCFDPHSSPGDVATLIERTLAESAPHRARHEVLQRYSWSVIWEKYLAPLLAGGQ
jgi:glycosyltransferase involved in cell wall biosynthesis